MESDGDDLENIFEEYENNENEGEVDNPAENNLPSNETAGAVKIAPPKRIVKNPRLKFNAERLCGERGIPVLVDHFKNVKFKGAGHEKEDLDKLLSKLEHWTHRLFPSMKFEDCLNHIEKLGKKRPVQTCLRKIRLDMPILYNDFLKDNEEDNVKRNDNFESEEVDAFDTLLKENEDVSNIDVSSPRNVSDMSSYSSPVPNDTGNYRLGSSFGSGLTDEQKERIERNRMLAAERRKARLAALAQLSTGESLSETHQTDSSEKVSNGDNIFDKLLDLSDNNEDNAQNHVSAIESNHNFEETSEKLQNLNMQNSENLGLDDLINLVDEEDPISDEEIAVLKEAETISSTLNNVDKFSDDSNNLKENFDNVSENASRENSKVDSSLDSLNEISADPGVNSDKDCLMKDISGSDENVSLENNSEFISMDCESGDI